MKYVLIIILFIILAAGCIATGDNTMTVKKGDHVFVHYTGTLDNGTKFDSSEGREPLEFDVGAGQMIKGFDAAVVGMKVGDEKTVKIPAKEAYGETDQKNILEVPKNNVPPGVKVGDTLYSRGQPAKVIRVTNSSVTIDANHPLAGKDLTFKIKLVKIGK